MTGTVATPTGHHRLGPHVDHLEWVAAQLDGLPTERLQGVLRTALDCTDDDLLAHLIDCEAVLYPEAERASNAMTGAIRVLRIDQRMITELRHGLRHELAGDLDQTSRVAVREKLHSLVVLLRGHMTKHEELFVPLFARLTTDQAETTEELN